MRGERGGVGGYVRSEAWLILKGTEPYADVSKLGWPGHKRLAHPRFCRGV